MKTEKNRVLSERFELGKRFIANRNLKDAINVFEKILIEKKDHIPSLMNLGICYFRLKEIPKAKEYFNQIVLLNPNDHLATYYEGLCYERSNQLDNAIKFYRDTLHIKPGFEKAREKLIYYKQEIPNYKKTEKPKLSDTITPGKELYEGNRRKRSFSFLFLITGIILIFTLFLIFYVDENKPEIYYLAGFFVLSLFFLFFYLLLLSKVTKYTIYEKRIDFQTGILFKKEVSLWIFQIEDIWLSRNFLNLLTNDAKIIIKTVSMEPPGGASRRTGNNWIISGFRSKDGKFNGNAKSMQKLWEEIRNSSIIERHRVKSIWV